MAYFFYRLNSPRPTFPADMSPVEAKAMGEHAVYWTEQMRKGSILAFGPVMAPDGPFGMGLVNSETIDEARTLVDDDPVIKANLGFSTDVFPMPRLVLPADITASR
jgi:uncharacterized protein YciI